MVFKDKVSAIFTNWKKWHLLQILVLSVLVLVLSFFGLLYYFSKDADISGLKNELPQATVFYDVNEDVASKVSANKNEGVSIKQVPDSMKNAIIAIEDHRFYQHKGVDLIGTSRALIRDLKAGGMVEGGSTITQQLTKNTLLTSQKTLNRKMEEVFLALQIEREYSKPEILQMYLNQIYFGNGAWGIKTAASKYFAKEVKDLSISESALLAGLIKAPSALNPYEHMEKATERRNLVLTQMRKQGYISSQQYGKAKHEKVVLNDRGGDPFRGKFPYYVDQVLDEAINQYGLSQDELLTGGFQIYTELEPTMQTAMEKTFQNEALFPEGKDRLIQSGGVLVDPKTGGIRAIVGGRGKHTFRGYNRASQLEAQPGSSFKPLAVYTPALENGWGISDMLKDEPMTFGDYQPSNYDHQYAGEVPMYEAVKESKNVSAVWLLNELGIEEGLDSIKRFGISLDKNDRNLSLALGGLHKGVSPLNMAEAFAVFPNHGVRVKTHAIKKIVDADGNVIAEWKTKKERVTTKAVTDNMTTMLLGVVEQGTGSAAQIPGRETAGKTGSTQVPIKGINGVKDQWFVGYTPQLVGAIWVGYDKTDANHYVTPISNKGSAVVFREVMTEALKNAPSESFNVPHIASLIEKKRQEEEAKRRGNFQENFNNEVQKWEEKWNKQKEKWKKKWMNKGNGKGH
ncbi:PBP1A family penicillin-binding protein [Bacillus sp. ISL-40]|uniref:transglycosylase domain-containing protein n=1 Tax=unclassified Bacillus (in: firmicutes) TaxID=185979 RepID=UPI001BE9CB24|nr:MULTISPECIES: PBP1A family penicillin-binding protein [unclassified Bacillus (in: firmicutes)]MBT2700159.1 PBP1A family penicillin-binding protein [Bacillus sp. ISL-40]MBT2721878.1 PBP1A family penicillin-binding protein [Bacillus sp. ISL-46]MBT2740443.1 PBP1A family penicillin-binding protein [Bacillus sp. ISL-77]